MSVKVKDVGNYKIHVKETTTDVQYTQLIWALCLIVGCELVCVSIFLASNPILFPIIFLLGFYIIVFSSFISFDNPYQDPAYYVDTTMYGVGGKTIRKITPEQDHIAICRAAQEFEKEILERITKEKELEEIVGKCK